MELSDNAKTVLAKRYLLKDASGKIIETPEEMCMRVAGILPVVKRPMAAIRTIGQRSI